MNKKYWRSGIMVRVPNELIEKLRLKHPEWSALAVADIVKIVLIKEVNEK